MPTKRKTSLQCSALPQTCQAAKAIATKGISVTRPVMIRSRVSLATGWMSEGRGPRARHAWRSIRADALKAASERRPGQFARVMRVRKHSAAAPRDRDADPGAPLHGRVLGRHAAARHRDGGPDLLRALAARRRPRAARARPARPRPRLRQRRDRGRRHGRGDRACSTAGSRRRWRAPTSARLLLGAVRAAGLTLPPRRPAAELRPSGRRHSQGARRARRPPPLRRLQRVLLALPRRLDDLQLRDLLARARRRSRRRRRRSSRWSAASWR